MADLAEKIEQFCAITGENTDAASHLLEACDGSVEAAIDLHMQSTSAPQQSSSTIHSPPEEDDDVRAPILPTSGVLMRHSYTQAHRAMNPGAQRRANGSSVFESHVDDQLEETNELIARHRAANGEGRARTSKEENKKQDLRALFRPPVDMIAAGTFEEVKHRASSTQTFLLINVQEVTEFACQALNRDVWSVSMIKDIVQNNFLFWQANTDTADGARVAAYYKVAVTPFVAIIDPRTGELVQLVPGNDVGVVADTLTTFICDHPTLDLLDEHRTRSGKRAAGIVDDVVEDDPPSISPPTAKRACPEHVEVIDWRTMLGTSETSLTLLLRLPSGDRHRQSFAVDTRIACIRQWARQHGVGHKTHELTINFPRRSFDDFDDASTLAECPLERQETVMAVRRA